MTKIVFSIFGKDELKAWIDILSDYDINWSMETIRDKWHPERQLYSIKAEISKETYDKLCHLAYVQYREYVG